MTRAAKGDPLDVARDALAYIEGVAETRGIGEITRTAREALDELAAAVGPEQLVNGRHSNMLGAAVHIRCAACHRHGCQTWGWGYAVAPDRQAVVS